VLGTGISSVATAVNDRGIIVGQSATDGYDLFHATLCSRIGAETQELNALISAAQAGEYELSGATGINDSCAIVANVYNKKTHPSSAFSLTLIDASNCVNGLKGSGACLVAAVGGIPGGKPNCDVEKTPLLQMLSWFIRILFAHQFTRIQTDAHRPKPLGDLSSNPGQTKSRFDKLAQPI
jgi:hypothetical protein